MIEELQAKFEAEEAEYQRALQTTKAQLELLQQEETSLRQQLQALSQQLSEVYTALGQTETQYYTAAAVYIETLTNALCQQLAAQRNQTIAALEAQLLQRAELEQTYAEDIATYQNICKDLKLFDLTESSAATLRHKKDLLEQRLAPYFAMKSALEVSLTVYTWHSSRLGLDIYVVPMQPNDPQNQLILAMWQQVALTYELEPFVWHTYQAYQVFPAGEVAQVELFDLLNQHTDVRWQVTYINTDLTSTTDADASELPIESPFPVDIKIQESINPTIDLDNPSYQNWYDNTDIGRWKRPVTKLAEHSERVLRSKEARRIRTLVMRMLAHGFIGVHSLPAEALWKHAPPEFQAEFQSHVQWLQQHHFLVPCTHFSTTHVSLNATKLDDFRAVIAYDLPGVWEVFAHVE